MTHTGGFSIGFANSDLTINPHFVLMCCDTIVVPALFIQVKVVSEPERIGVFLTRHVTDISCGVVYKATLASLV